MIIGSEVAEPDWGDNVKCHDFLTCSSASCENHKGVHLPAHAYQ